MKIQTLSIAFAFSQPFAFSSAKSLRAEEQSRSNKRDERIIGGVVPQEDRHSYAVALRDKAGVFCGGSLVAKDVVLTAAHCLGAPFDVVVGRHSLRDKDGQAIPIKRQLPHPNYDERTTDNDFMLVFLRRPATAKNARLVKLNKVASRPKAGAAVTVMGWGDTDIRDNVSNLSNVLRKTNVDVVSKDACEGSSGSIGGRFESYRGQITQNMLCAKANRRDSCQGDSGGPLVITGRGGDVQVGIVSWGIGCASPKFPGVYARVSRAYSWIEREVCKGSQYASKAGFNCGGINGGGNNKPTASKPSRRPTKRPSRKNPAPAPSPNNDDDWWFSLWEDDCNRWWC